MSWFRKLFTKMQNNQNETADPGLHALEEKSTQPISQKTEDKQNNWYIKQTADQQVTQIVFSAPVSCIRETEFGVIILPYDKYPVLVSQSWSAGFVKMSEAPVPHLIVRVDEFDEDVRKSDITIAMSFCKLPTSGIFWLVARIENTAISKKIRRKFKHLPAFDKPFSEWLVGMDDKYSVQMMKDVFSSPSLNIIVANSQGFNTTFFDENANSFNCEGPCANHDRIVPFDINIKSRLANELKALISYHNTIPKSERHFQYALEELSILFPTDQEPILAPAE